MLKLY